MFLEQIFGPESEFYNLITYKRAFGARCGEKESYEED